MSTAPLLAHGELQKVENSKQLSAIVRTLALTAFASAWLLAGALNDDAKNAYTILGLLKESDLLRWVAAAAVAALGFDVLQYAAGTLAWSTWSWSAATLTQTDADPTSKQYAFAYWAAKKAGLVNDELTAKLAAEPLTDADTAGSLETSVASPTVTFHQAVTKEHPAVVERFSVEGASGLIALLPTAFFTAKVAAFIVSWVALMCYVI